MAADVSKIRMTRHATLAEACRSAKSYTAAVLPAISMGDDGRYWLTTAKDAAILRKAGYEQVSRFDWID